MLRGSVPGDIRLDPVERSSLAGLPAGDYVFTAKAGVLKDPFGQSLDGNSDGVAGDDLQLRFKLS